MKRTHPTTLVIVGLVGLVVGFLLDSGLTATGNPVVVPPVTLTVTLVVIGAIVITLAWPIRRAVRGAASSHMDPFRAARTAVLAKASSLAGALFAGASAGLLAYMLTRTVLGASSSLWLTVSALVAGVVLLVCGLVAEAFCTLPPPGGEPDDPDADRDDPRTTSHSHL